MRFIRDESHVVDMMNALDILMLPSINNDDFPNVILEAMGLGKGVIASALAGTPEQVVQEETGILVKPGNAEAFAIALGQLVNQPELSKSLGVKGKERFPKMFVPDIAVTKYMD